MNDQKTDREGGGVRFSKLRITASAVSGTVFLLLIVLWVRSYSSPDLLHLNLNNPTAYAVASSKGNLFLLRSWDARRAQGTPLVLRELPANGRKALVWHADKIDGRTRDAMSLPLWLPVVLTAAFAVIPLIPWAKRFSLRTLLIAITLLAVVLGLVVWAAK
jgi:hypothetical protein